MLDMVTIYAIVTIRDGHGRHEAVLEKKVKRTNQRAFKEKTVSESTI